MSERRDLPKINAPVIIVFFIRPDTLRQVFDSVRCAKPPKLFLVQDGPRADHPDDLEKIEACRKIVENIDWACEVHRNYSEVNLSAHKRIITGISWAFEHTDRLIYLEDDIVPTECFYPFCADVLERFKDDERFFDVCGAQKLGEYKGYPYDCIYTSMALGNGFGLWKRSWDKVMETLGFSYLNDPEFMGQIFPNLKSDPVFKCNCKTIIKKAQGYKQALECEGKYPDWNFLVWTTNQLHFQLSVMTAKNMTRYIGVGDDAENSGSDITWLNPKIRRVFTAKTYNDLEFPLKYPPFIVRNTQFERIYMKKTRPNSILAILYYEFNRAIHGDLKGVLKGLIRKLRRKPN